MRFPRIVQFLAVCTLILATWPLRLTHAQADQSLRVVAQTDGVRLEWRGNVESTTQGYPSLRDWPLRTIGELELPAQLVALRVPAGVPVQPRIEQLTSHAWGGSLRPAETIVPRTFDGELRADLAQSIQSALPAAPVVQLREARVRGVPLVVLAVSPVFAQAGAPRAATSLRVFVPGVSLFDARAADLLATTSPFLASAAPPTNPAASRSAWKIQVDQAGMQQLSAAALVAAGVDLNAVAQLHLWRAGQQVSLEERRDSAGALAELRFYAPAPGDRWNAVDTYWLTIEAGPGQRIGQRDVSPGGAPLQTTALERGVWRENRLYDSTMPGPDGDHWYAADLKTGPDLVTATLTAALTPTLPLVAGSTTLTVTGSAYTISNHQLRVRLSGAQANTGWVGTGSWAKTFTLAANGAEALLELVPGGVLDGVEVDNIAWERPVSLDVDGRGAMFTGLPGTWRYQLANTPADHALYDVSDPHAPTLLALPDGTAPQFQDDGQHTYLLAGPGTLHTPTLAAHTPSDIGAPLAADVLYIAPALFHSTLAPLADLRREQGYRAQVVDVQAIYDGWSYGRVDPEAIRSYLRNAAATWSRVPSAVVLVGDGTSDPLNYTRRNNTNFIPPYLAMVDPWLGETACDTCYAQLDGAEPITSAAGDVLPDIAIGRLPVKSAAELASVISKISTYEAAAGSWRLRSLYAADDADSGGDFAAYAEASIALQSPDADIERVYYDPNGAGQPGAQPDPVLAREEVIAAFNEGVGFANYIGHGSPFQWAVTGPPLDEQQPADKQYLLNSNDAGSLTNRSHLPIVLEMTCLTSAFQVPAYSGTSLGERLVVNPQGGAAAVWGPTGNGVAHGHDSLQTGFYQALWGAGGPTSLMGTLTLAGYLELFGNGCCPDTILTYVLLGDPLLRVSTDGSTRLHLPLMTR